MCRTWFLRALKQETTVTTSQKQKRQGAGWDDAYREPEVGQKVLFGKAL
jgi:hypothetical protein